MKKDGGEIRGLDGGSKRFHLLFIQRRIFPSPRVSGEELDGLAAPRLSPFDDSGEPSCNGDMKTKSHLDTFQNADNRVSLGHGRTTHLISIHELKLPDLHRADLEFRDLGYRIQGVYCQQVGSCFLEVKSHKNNARGKIVGNL